MTSEGRWLLLTRWDVGPRARTAWVGTKELVVVVTPSIWKKGKPGRVQSHHFIFVECPHGRFEKGNVFSQLHKKHVRSEAGGDGGIQQGIKQLFSDCRVYPRRQGEAIYFSFVEIWGRLKMLATDGARPNSASEYMHCRVRTRSPTNR